MKKNDCCCALENNMNKATYGALKLLSIAVVIVISITISVSAHPGRTDSKGGHHDRINGGYHYHHGYPAHDHPNGVCPYDFKDKTSHKDKQSAISLPVVLTSPASLVVYACLLAVSVPFAFLSKTDKIKMVGKIIMVASLYVGIICCIRIFPLVKEITINIFRIAAIIMGVDFLLGNLLDRYLTKTSFFFNLFLYLSIGLLICSPFALAALFD